MINRQARAKMLPLGKLPPLLLSQFLSTLSAGSGGHGDRIIIGPGVGLDCAVVEFGDRCLVAKTDPITFASDEIGWYAVQINANDIACSGAEPLFFLVTILLPEAPGNAELARLVFNQIRTACSELGVALIGGHTEITQGISRPIVVGTMLGEVAKDRLITSAGARPGDQVLLTKGYPIEAVSIIAREAAGRLGNPDPVFLQRCRAFLQTPGISVVRDARIALGAGTVTAMHDPTEGGIATGLWEIAEASNCGIEIRVDALPLLPEGEILCRLLHLDPIGCIASGALLLTVPESDAVCIKAALEKNGIPAHVIGRVTEGCSVNVHRPERDELTRLFSPT